MPSLSSMTKPQLVERAEQLAAELQARVWQVARMRAEISMAKPVKVCQPDNVKDPAQTPGKKPVKAPDNVRRYLAELHQALRIKAEERENPYV